MKLGPLEARELDSREQRRVQELSDRRAWPRSAVETLLELDSETMDAILAVIGVEVDLATRQLVTGDGQLELLQGRVRSLFDLWTKLKQEWKFLHKKED